MFRGTIIITIILFSLTLSATTASSASADWFIEGEELSGTTELATTAAVVENAKLEFSAIAVECKGKNVEGISAQIESPNKISATSLKFTECSSGTRCKLKSPTVGTLPVSAEVTQEGTLQDEAVFTPKTKPVFATLAFEGSMCSIAGEVQPVTGQATTSLPTGQEKETTQEIKANTPSGELKVGSSAATFKGAAELSLASGQKWQGVGGPVPPRVEQVNFTNNIAVTIDHQKDVFPEKAVEIGNYEGKAGEGKDAIEWKSPKAGEVTKNWPIAYPQKTKIKLEVKLPLEVATQEFLEKKIEGEPLLTGEATFGGTTLKFEKKFTAAAIKANKGFLATGEIESNVALPAKVLYALTGITWKFEYKGIGAAATKVKLGNTTHNLYTTFESPLGGTEVYLTVLDMDTLGIEKEAALNEGTTIAGTWKGFSSFEGTPSIPSVHIRTYNPSSVTGELDRVGKVLEYYGEVVKPKKTLTEVYKEEITNAKRLITCPGAPFVALMETGAGRCGAWAEALVGALATEGVKSELVHLFAVFGAAKTVCATRNVCIMLVKNWSFGMPGFGEFPYETNQVTDEEGVPGQGVKNPPPFFWDHAIVDAGKAGSAALYDPSYGKGPFLGTEIVKPGTEKSVLEEYQKKDIDGYCRSTVVEQEEVEKSIKGNAAPIECQKTPAALELTPVNTFTFP